MMTMHNGIWYETCTRCKGKGVLTNGDVMTICDLCDGDCYIPHEHQPDGPETEDDYDAEGSLHEEV